MGKTRLVFLFIVLLNYADSESELMPSSGSGSASGSDLLFLIDPPTCDTYSITLDVNLFDTIVNELLQLNCKSAAEEYTIVFKSSELALDLMEHDYATLFADYFDYSDTPQTFSIEVCSYSILTGDICSSKAISVSATISRHNDRLLPFGVLFSDNSVKNADDRSVGVFLPNPIPFWSRYYNSIYLSTNGVLSFGRPFTQFWPVTFPYGRSTVPVIAPYWNDMDFRNGITDSGLYFHTYASSGTKRDEAFLQEFSDRLDTYTEGNPSDFKPNWMIVATWYKATPYYGRSNMNETLTFQLLLASDSVDTYAIFLYEEGGINWDREHRRIVIGYDAKDYVNYLNVDNSEEFIIIDSITGNTGNAGEWYFKLTGSGNEVNFEQECFKWVTRQEEDTFEKYFEGLPSCPCTRWQAWRDWRFWFGWRWGLSSGPNCATLIWSGRRSTIECCYDDSGALQVAGISGGSYKLYHPLFSNTQYIINDKQPREHCCQFSKLCHFFYSHRPSDNCSRYEPSRISFTWGDPHFQTVDGHTYTFNGLGEYVLLRSLGNDLEIQVRLTLLDMLSTDFNATVISAVVVRQGTAQVVQVEESDEGPIVYVNGVNISIPTEEDSNLIVTESATFNSLDVFFMSDQNISTADRISLRYDNDDIIIATSSGASLMVSNSSSVLHLAVEVGDTFINTTEGILGYLNGDPSDDFRRPNGSILSINSTEREIFDYGKQWHIDETQSLFEYFDERNYSYYNNGWDTHIPTFQDELSDTEAFNDVQTICGDDSQCIFDYAVTNDVNFAAATHAVTMNNQETQNILNNRAPVLEGALRLYVNSGQSFMEPYLAYDQDGDNISVFELKTPHPEDIALENITETMVENITYDGLIAWLVWGSPGSELPSTAIQILVNDSLGAVTVRNISVVLCACENNGTCINATTPQYNNNGHYLQECDCPDYFSGDLCETDDRSCSDTSCPEYSVCEVNSSVPAGFTCSSCRDGYELDNDGKCVDINECNTTNTQYMHNCTQICNNTEGSYECLCMDGYELDEDGRNCSDINECYEGTDSCANDQMCANTEGSFSCSCFPPEIWSEDHGCIVALCSGQNSCEDGGICVDDTTPGQAVCVCRQLGTFCTGNCSGTYEFIMEGNQSCSACEENTYGYRCGRVCDCENGDCDPVDGCMCHEGYNGTHCETEINDVAPKFAEGTINELTLSWNLPRGVILAKFNATDSDVGAPGEVAFSLSHGHQLPMNISSGKDIFSIDNKTGILTLDEDLNTTRGVYIRFVLSVVATDLGENPRSSEVIVTILLEDTPAPIPSFNEDIYVIEIFEDTIGNSTVLNLTCSEPEEATGTSNLTVVLIGSNDSSLFSLDGEFDDLMLVLLKEIDYETLPNAAVPHYSLELTCTNQYAIMTSASIEIEIINIDDNAFVFDNSTYSVSVPENVPRNYTVLVVSAFDPDIPDGTILYDTTSPDTFSIFPNGTVYVANPVVNREVEDEYILNIEAKLNNDETTEATVKIFITDINEGPPVFGNLFYLSENLTTANTVGDVALTVTAVDEDLGKNGSVVYSLEENSLFSINSSTGDIYVNKASIVALYGSYVLFVYASDEGNPPMNSSTRVNIYVAPVPDRIVFRNFPLSLNISEDRPRGFEITTIVAEVIDRNNGTIDDAQTVGNIEYKIVATNDSENFHIGRFSGNLILLNSLDFEEERTYRLNITASIPSWSLESAAITEVLVTDVNDNSPTFTPIFYTKVVEEFTESGTSILTVLANDVDSGINGDVTYQLGDETVPFSIDSVTGVVEVSGSLNTPLDYRFHVIAKDGGTPAKSSEAVVFISVVRSASVVPQFDRQRYTFNVSENTPTGTQIGSVLAQVEGSIGIDEYNHLLYRLQMPDMDMGVNNTILHIDSSSGDVFVLAELNAEQQDFYAVYVEVYNASNHMQVFDTATIEVHVEDINDHAPQFEQSLYTDVITTATPQNSTLFRVHASDGDADSVNSQIEYTLQFSTFGFGINQLGDISILNSTLLVGDYHLTVVATDSGEPSMSGTALVFIAVILAEPEDILFEEREYNFSISENASLETLVGKIVAQDHNRMPFDDGSDLRYYFSNDSVIESVCLNIGEFSGEVQVSCPLDRERDPRYTLVVSAVYEGNQTGEVRMTVNVLDINDNLPIFTKDVYAIVVPTTYGNSSAILKVSAVDIDDGFNGLVHYSFSSESASNTLFRIESMSGDIYSLNEVIPAGDYRLVVTASDSNPTMPETSTAVVFICVVHEEPNGALQIVTTSLNIDENSRTETVVGTVMLQAGGVDINPENYVDNLEFSIIMSDVFVINRNNGTVKVVGVLDREKQGSYEVEVEANFKDYNISTISIVTIQVGDINDNSPVFNPSTYSAIIDDSYLYNDSVPTAELFATDVDEGANAEIQFYIDEINPFGVRPTGGLVGELNGEIFVKNTSLLEPGRQYLFNVIAADKGTPPRSSSATVHIEVEFALPDTISFPQTEYAFNYTEHSDIGTIVGVVTVEQETPALNGLVYSVSGGSGLYRFHIDQSTGEISNLVSLDREENTEFLLNITAQLPQTDIVPATTSVIITVLDINDKVPLFDRSSYSIAVFEDDIVTDSPLINVSASDADSGLNALVTYSISPNDTFRITENGNIFALFDSVQVDTYRLSVEARDMGNVPLTGTAIVIIDVRQSIPESISFSQSQYVFNISEYNTSGTVVGQIGLDPPLTNFAQYRRFYSSSSDFVVVTQSGIIQSLRQFDREAFNNEEAAIDFQASCILNLPHENPPVSLMTITSIRVNIQDENDNDPEFVDFPSNLYYQENVTQEEMIAQLSATDNDIGTNADLTFEILNHPSETLFRIETNTGELFVEPGLDREQQEVHIITVQVKDQGQGNSQRSVQSDITLTLLDINDNNPTLLVSEFSVEERFTGNVFQLQYQDSDEGENARATFRRINSDNSDNRFEINSTTGSVTLTETLDYEVAQTVSFIVKLADNPNDPSNSNTPQYTVTVNVIDKPDNVPVFEQSGGYSVSIDPSITTDELFLDVHATDNDGDAITYEILQNSNASFVRINTTTGQLYFTETEDLETESVYEIILKATDNSVYQLSSTTTVIITVNARTLKFEKESYAASIDEDADTGRRGPNVRVDILSQSNDLTFTLEIISPSGVLNPFIADAFRYSVTLELAHDLNRETVSSYLLQVTASRPSSSVPDIMETATVLVNITVLDVNDNWPVIETPDPSYSISEVASINSPVAQVIASDNDVGENKTLVYSIISPTGSPFKIDNEGLIMVRQNLDFETQELYTLTIQVEDLGTPALSSTAQYNIQVLNENDKTPRFKALAYFGELYSEAPDNSDVHHTMLEVTDEDGESEFTFSISPFDPTDTSTADYQLVVSDRAPYYIKAESIPNNAESGLRRFVIEVSDEDGMHKNTTIFHLGVFGREHLLSITLFEISIDEFLPSVTVFLQLLSTEFTRLLGQPVSYYYDSLEESKEDTRVLTMTVYGWYGTYGTRYNNGEEEGRDLSNSVIYVTYEDVNKESLDSVAYVVTESSGIEAVIGDVPETVLPPGTNQQTANSTATVGIASGAVVIVLLLVLLIVSIIVFGRRRKPKKEKDPYDLSYRARKRRGKRPDSIPLTPKATSSDLAYETMYDDDDMLNQQQTMPWFDPNYLAPNEGEGYDGDIEQSSSKKGGLRATVDGDAKRNRRHSSDESVGGGSVTELDTSRYLRSYQQATPMQPGQRMAEYDMFVNPNARDSDRPYRPPLHNITGLNQGHQRSTHA